VGRTKKTLSVIVREHIVNEGGMSFDGVDDTFGYKHGQLI